MRRKGDGGAPAACHESLRSFRNQAYHNPLRLGLAREFLHDVLQDAGALQ